MKQCPMCKLYMCWYMTYINGKPYSGWRCICGYDTMRARIFTSTNTEPSAEQFSVVDIPSEAQEFY